MKPRQLVVALGLAGGMLATARVMGQTLGAAMVGLLMAQAGLSGATWSLAVASGLALLAAAVSMSRLRVLRAGE